MRLVEADSVCTPDPKDGSGVDGIVFDAAGNPVEYHVLREHPGDTASRLFLEYDRLPATSVLHWFRADRPASKGAVPWFWHFDERRYAVWWDSEGLPFVQGPKLLFTHSGNPRIDREECGLLDPVVRGQKLYHYRGHW